MDSSTIVISGMGSYVPKKFIRTSKLNKYTGLSSDYVLQVGINKVHKADENEFPADMAILAAREALKQAEVSPDQIDVLVFSNFGVPEYYYWAHYAKIHHELKTMNAQAFYLNQCHNSQIRAIEFGTNLLKTNAYVQHVLVVSADSYNFVADRWKSFMGTFLSDGASACVLSKGSGDHQIINFKESCCEDYYCSYRFPDEDLFTVLREKSYLLTDRLLEVKGFFDELSCDVTLKSLYESVASNIAGLLKSEGLTMSHIDKIITLNFNKKFCAEISNILKKNIEDTSWSIGSEFGHMGPTDILFNFEKMIERQKLKKGAYAVLLGISLDFSIMSCLVKC